MTAEGPGGFRRSGVARSGAELAPICCIVGKTWNLHVKKVLRVDKEENLSMIAESVAFLVGEGKTVFYDAEHFFDAYLAHPDYALVCLRTAADAGAHTVVLCDTNGATLPHRLARSWTR